MKAERPSWETRILSGSRRALPGKQEFCPACEVVRAAGEIELVGGVLRRCSWPQRRTVELGTKARARVVSIPSIIEDFDDGRAHSVGASFVAVVAPPLVTEPSGFQALTNGG